MYYVFLAGELENFVSQGKNVKTKSNKTYGHWNDGMSDTCN